MGIGLEFPVELQSISIKFQSISVHSPVKLQNVHLIVTPVENQLNSIQAPSKIHLNSMRSPDDGEMLRVGLTFSYSKFDGEFN